MYSLSIDFLLNKLYDGMLWIRYTWLFTLWHKDPNVYLKEHAGDVYDGLRDRGWIHPRVADIVIPPSQVEVTTPYWHGVPDRILDESHKSSYHASPQLVTQLHERFGAEFAKDYSWWDKVRVFFGFDPVDSDHDGVPDSYEIAHHMDPYNPDSDNDGLPDGQELVMGTDPLNNDTDGDGVLDGRDAFPMDPTRSVAPGDVDSDHDGVGDNMEALLGTDPHKRDTDGDGIPDGMDSYPTDPHNANEINLIDWNSINNALHTSIQNPVLSFFSDMLSIAAIIAIVFLVYTILKWILIFIEAHHHFDHHFHHDEHGKVSGHHVIKDIHSKEATITHPEAPAGIPNLPIASSEHPSAPPSPSEFDEHPRLAIIKGYMSSDSEALWRIGILEADNMLADLLQEREYQGEGVAEMLSNASFSTIQQAWDAHFIRNRIAHEGSNFELTEREAKRAFTLFSEVFKDLGVTA